MANAEVQIINNILLFIERAQLSGKEVPAFHEAITYLLARKEELVKDVDL